MVILSPVNEHFIWVAAAAGDGERASEEQHLNSAALSPRLAHWRS